MCLIVCSNGMQLEMILLFIEVSCMPLRILTCFRSRQEESTLPSEKLTPKTESGKLTLTDRSMFALTILKFLNNLDANGKKTLPYLDRRSPNHTNKFSADAE
jgi:hypothetical protein